MAACGVGLLACSLISTFNIQEADKPIERASESSSRPRPTRLLSSRMATTMYTKDKNDEALPHFVVTGFGPFQGVTENPTTTIVNELRTYLSNVCDIGLTSCTPKQLASNVTTHIFETSAEDVRQWQDEWFERLSREVERGSPARGGGETDSEAAAAELCDQGRNDVVLLHLGVHYKAKCFHLESSAFNDASFRVPDERGYQPKEECVLPAGDGCHGDRLSTTLKVPLLVKKMESRGYPSKLSGDPGRFVCNYTYCYSLNKCSRFNSTVPTPDTSSVVVDGAERRPTLSSIFVHVPLLQITGKEEQLEFLAVLLDEITMCLRGKRSS